MIAEQDVQPVSDMRLIALVMLKRWTGDSRYRAEAAAMQKIVFSLETMIAEGPESGRHVIEATGSIAQLQAELRQSVFGRPT